MPARRVRCVWLDQQGFSVNHQMPRTGYSTNAHVPFEKMDCAILFGDGTWPEIESRLLIPESVLPLAAPRFSEELDDLSTPNQSKTARIHLEDPEHWWRDWTDWQAQFAPDSAYRDLVSVCHVARILHQGPRMLAEFATALVKYPG